MTPLRIVLTADTQAILAECERDALLVAQKKAATINAVIAQNTTLATVQRHTITFEDGVMVLTPPAESV